MWYFLTENTRVEREEIVLGEKSLTKICQSNSNDSEMIEATKQHPPLLGVIEDEHPLLSRLCETLDFESSDTETDCAQSDRGQINSTLASPPHQVNISEIEVANEITIDVVRTVTVPVISAVSSAFNPENQGKYCNVIVPVISSVNSVVNMCPVGTLPVITKSPGCLKSIDLILPATVPTTSISTVEQSKMQLNKPVEKHIDHSYYRDFSKKPTSVRRREVRRSNPIIIENGSQIEIVEPIECSDSNMDCDADSSDNNGSENNDNSDDQLISDRPGKRNASMHSQPANESVIQPSSKRPKVFLNDSEIQSTATGTITCAALDENSKGLTNSCKWPGYRKTYSNRSSEKKASSATIASSNQTSTTEQPVLDKSIEKPTLVTKNIKILPQGSRKCAFQLLKEGQETPRPTIQLYKCRRCDYICANDVEYKKHLDSHKSDKIYQAKHDKTAVNSTQKVIKFNTFNCHNCKIGFPNRDDMVMHCKKMKHRQLELTAAPLLSKTKTLRRDQLECPVCLIKQPNLDEFKLHMLAHNDKDSLVCTKCYKSFLKAEHLKSHLEQHAADSIKETVLSKRIQITFAGVSDKTVTSYMCTDCNETFVSAREHALHARQHFMFKCNLCSKLFSTETLYNQHVRRTHDAQHARKHLHKCNICSEQFSTETLYKLHVRRKHDVFVDIET